MKIANGLAQSIYKFGDLDPGDVFRNPCGDICMKLDVAFDDPMFKAVDLSNGMLFDINLYTEVTPICCELVPLS